jgi:hypothetical protein
MSAVALAKAEAGHARAEMGDGKWELLEGRPPAVSLPNRPRRPPSRACGIRRRRIDRGKDGATAILWRRALRPETAPPLPLLDQHGGMNE